MLGKDRLFLHEGVDQKSYSHQYKRDAEQLAHIQNHVLLKHDLRFLDELDEETHSETSDEEGSDKEASVHLLMFESVY